MLISYSYRSLPASSASLKVAGTLSLLNLPCAAIMLVSLSGEKTLHLHTGSAKKLEMMFWYFQY